MKLKSLTLQNFRNYSARKFDFTADKVVFVGNNGRGKTNALEALSVFSVGKSWREVNAFVDGEKKCNLIQAKIDDLPAVISLVTTQENIYDIQIFPRKRVFKKNNKQIPRKKHLGEIPSLLFAPEHLEIFSATKRIRQSFFDRFLCQLYPQYKDLLSKTLRIIKQKNVIFLAARGENYLSEEKLKAQLGPWNKILQKNIPAIWKYREKFLAELEPLLQEELSKISENSDEIRVFLTRGGLEKENQSFQTCQSPDFGKSGLDFSREFQARRCLFSPTRDDFTFFYRGQPIMNTVSRGEIRSVLLSLLSAKKNFFFQKTNQMLILLLDDCFSELDDNRQAGLERLCEGTQAFFTTTHKEHFAKFTGEVQKIEI